MREDPQGLPAAPQPAVRTVGMESTATLLARIRSGDETARERLIRRYLPALQRWAHGRMGPRVRDLMDTGDLVQLTVIRALNHMEDFESRRQGAFLSYLRTILLNQIRDQARRVARAPGRESLPDELHDPAPSPLEVLMGRETLERYETALARLTPDQREAVVMRVEMGFTYAEIAEALGGPSANAARMLVTRALVRMAEAMDESR
jgi:RNA polymerase sigma-70 factor (ECF subfamily)